MKDTNILIANGVDLNKSLELLGDMAMYDSLLNDYLDAYQDRMKKIDTYKNTNDMPNYAIEVHSLKSDAKYLGFTTLADLSYEHELASKANDINTVNNNYQALLQEANRIYEVIKQYLQKDEVVSESSVTVDSQNQFEKPPQVELITKEQIDLSTKAILIADDSSIIRNFVEETFSKNYDVIMAKDGKEVLNIISSNPNKIAALLLDLNMPNIDGFQVLEYLKQNNLFEKIPVSIITGAVDKDTIDKAFTYPIVDMLNKPFDMEAVKLVVEKTIAFNND